MNAINEYAAGKEKFLSESSKVVSDSKTKPDSSTIPKNTLYVVNRKIATNQQAKEVDPKDIESINVIKGDSAVKKYGEKGKNGVIEIITNKTNGNVTIVNTDATTVSPNNYQTIQFRIKCLLK